MGKGWCSGSYETGNLPTNFITSSLTPPFFPKYLFQIHPVQHYPAFSLSFMSDTSRRRRTPRSGIAQRHSIRPPHPSPSPRRLSPLPPPRRLSTKHRSKPIEIFKRCSSEPNILASSSRSSDDDDDQQEQKILFGSESERILYTQTCADIFGSSSSLPGLSLHSLSLRSEGYNKDAKVVINVSVEASTGPIRAMVKLGCSVEEIIKLVVKRYRDEGRTPKLDKDEAFELHPSYFSLQSLNKSERIGDVGSRSFFLRRSGNKGASNSLVSETCIGVRPHSAALPMNPPPFFLFSSFIVRKVRKIVRVTHKIWKVLICEK